MGVYLLHFWEGEVRECLGQGWVVGRPTQKIIQNLKERVVNVSIEIQKFIKEPPKVIIKKSKSKLDVMEVKEFPEEGPRVPKPVDVWEYLAKEASRSLKIALVPFYGCSKCRYSRGGRIWWMCNPQKFAKHLKDFPEKYEGKVLRPAIWKSISLAEFGGTSGGGL